jgi:inhibitor of cysteine peptidase
VLYRRRVIALALICLCILAPSWPTGQAKLMMEKNISIFVDGEQLPFPDQQPFIDQHHRTLVPVRFFAQALGASVEWQALQKQVLIRTSDKTLSLKVGEAEVLIHPDRIERMDSVAVLVNNRLLVPLRHISNYLDCQVSWDESSRIAHVFTQGQSKEEIKELMEKARHAILDLPRVNSQENLQALLDQSGNYNKRLRTGAGSSVAQEQMLDKSATADLEAASDYSGTNVQVEGVDEGDIIKSDGEYLYVVKNQEILLVKAYPAEEMSVAGRISLAQNTQEIFVEQDRLLVISRDRPYYYRSSAVAEGEALKMPPYYKNNIIYQYCFPTFQKI